MMTVVNLKFAFLVSGNSFTDAPLSPDRVTGSLPVCDYSKKNYSNWNDTAMQLTTESYGANEFLPKSPTRDDELRDVSKKLEATFLAEMLISAGFGKTPDAFGGGEGEDQFASFLIQAQAEKMVKAGGIGLAEQLFEALKERADGII
jgi:Rod binding domain-containing protein